MSVTSRQSLRTRAALRTARIVALALLVTGLLGGSALGTAAAAARMSANEIVRSSVLLIITDCPAAADPDDDDPDEIEDLLDGRCNLIGNGSGTIIDSSGLILTNAHVVLAGGTDPDDARWIQVAMTADPRELPTFEFFARPIAVDTELDLALIQVAFDARGRDVDPDDLDLPALELAKDTADLELEDPLRLIGYPGVGGVTVTVVESRVAGFHFDVEHEELGNTAWIKTNPAAGAGVSGGTAVNEAGELVGVPTAGFGTELRCQDLDGDGQNDPATECEAMTGEVQLVRPIEFVHQFLDGVDGGAGRDEGRTVNDPFGGGNEDDADDNRPRDDEDDGRGNNDDDRGSESDVATVEVAAELVDSETDDPLAGGFLVILQPGVTCATLDVDALANGDDGQLLTGAVADRDGIAVAEAEVEVGADYGLIVAAEDYMALCFDDVVLAEDEDTTETDLGLVALDPA
jgi:S1-C subfamily serine protease